MKLSIKAELIYNFADATRVIANTAGVARPAIR